VARQRHKHGLRHRQAAGDAVLDRHDFRALQGSHQRLWAVLSGACIVDAYKSAQQPAGELDRRCRLVQVRDVRVN